MYNDIWYPRDNIMIIHHMHVPRVPHLPSSQGKQASEYALERSAGRSDSSPAGFGTSDECTAVSSPGF